MTQHAVEPIQIPGAVQALARRIDEAGGRLFIVGGWLRDRMLGIDCKDVDLATELPPGKVKKAVKGLGSIYDIGERFGTLGIARDDYILEITTFRSEEYSAGSRHPEVTHIDEVEDDLSRRDFTMNAMALMVAPSVGDIVDPFGGRQDLAAQLIRTPGPPGPRMREDPLRMMRAVRFSAQLGFRIDDALLEAIRDLAHQLVHISWERRRDELEKTLVAPEAGEGVRLLVDTGLMHHVCGEIEAMEGVDQPEAFHRADVLGHTLLTMSYVSASPLLRRAALFHDVGKPPARVTEPKVMFPEHDRVGADLTRKAMKRLKYGKADIARTVFMVHMHMRPIHYDPEVSDGAVRRLVRDCTLARQGEVLVSVWDVIELARADVEAGNLQKAVYFRQILDDLCSRIHALDAADELEKIHSPLDGRELMELFGRDPGPWLRPVKEYLAHLVIEGELAPDDKEGASRLAREFLGSNERDDHEP
jgi:poly(A) polymerase